MTDVVMPQMGESIVEGTLTKWLKKAGERIERDEPLFEISTDKVDTEIPSPAAGTLAEILVEEGKTVGINTIVARIDEGGAAMAHRGHDQRYELLLVAGEASRNQRRAELQGQHHHVDRLVVVDRAALGLGVHHPIVEDVVHVAGCPLRAVDHERRVALQRGVDRLQGVKLQDGGFPAAVFDRDVVRSQLLE